MRQEPAAPTAREIDPSPDDPAVSVSTIPAAAGRLESADQHASGGNGVWIAFLLGVIALLAVCVVLTLVAANRPFP